MIGLPGQSANKFFSASSLGLVDSSLFFSATFGYAFGVVITLSFAGFEAECPGAEIWFKCS
jgi:hypothetical protein